MQRIYAVVNLRLLTIYNILNIWKNNHLSIANNLHTLRR